MGDVWTQWVPTDVCAREDIGQAGMVQSVKVIHDVSRSDVMSVYVVNKCS